MNLSQVPVSPIVPPFLDAQSLRAEEPRPLWHMPVDIRSASLALLAALACIYTLYWAKAVFIPVLLGLLSSYALTPVVDRLERLRIPRVLASALLLLSIVAGLGWTAYKLSDDATELIASLPEVAQKFRQTMQRPNGTTTQPATPLDQVQQAATELEKTGESNASGTSPARAA